MSEAELQRQIIKLRRDLDAMAGRLQAPVGQIRTIVQTAHGFVAGEVLRLSGSTWVKAQADTAANAQAVGVVGCVISTNAFQLYGPGTILPGLSGRTAGARYYLDASTAGAVTTTAPAIGMHVYDAISTNVVRVALTVSGAPYEFVFGTGTATKYVGDTSWTVPAGVLRATADIYGAGGGGGGGDAIAGGVYGVTSGGAVSSQIYHMKYGGGGGGGAIVRVSFDTTPGESISLVVGAGGTGGTGANYGSDGAASTITISGVTYTAGGGQGGPWYNGNTGGAYGFGGTPSTPQCAARRAVAVGHYGEKGDRVVDTLSFNSLSGNQATNQRGGWGYGYGGYGARNASIAGSGADGVIVFTW